MVHVRPFKLPSWRKRLWIKQQHHKLNSMTDVENIFYYQGSNSQSSGVTGICLALCHVELCIKKVQYWLREVKRDINILFLPPF